MLSNFATWYKQLGIHIICFLVYFIVIYHWLIYLQKSCGFILLFHLYWLSKFRIFFRSIFRSSLITVSVSKQSANCCFTDSTRNSSSTCDCDISIDSNLWLTLIVANVSLTSFNDLLQNCCVNEWMIKWIKWDAPLCSCQVGWGRRRTEGGTQSWINWTKKKK